MIDINGKTSVYGIIGNPVAHSLSPLFQNTFIQQAQLNAVYLPFHVEPHALAQALTGLHAAQIQGLNITVPYKEQVMAFVDADADATTIGAVNTLKRMDNGWHATNTDWQGFASVLQGLQVELSQTPVLIFGAGGTSRAVFHALHHQGVKEVYICNRSPERAIHLVEDLRQAYPAIQINTLSWEAEMVLKTCQACQVIINTSSIGLNENDVFPFVIKGQGMAIDAVYKPHGETAFSHAANRGGYTAIDGLPMLIAQGIASFQYWHHHENNGIPLNFPDNLQSLQWVEQQLERQPIQLPGWRT